MSQKTRIKSGKKHPCLSFRGTKKLKQGCFLPLFIRSFFDRIGRSLDLFLLPFSVLRQKKEVGLGANRRLRRLALPRTPH